MKNSARSLLVYIAVGALLFGFGAPPVLAAGYSAYRDDVSMAPAEQAVDVPLSDFTSADGSSHAGEIDGKPVVYTSETDTVTWKVNVPAAGVYQMELTYYTVAGKGDSIVRQLHIDGALPFDEAASIRLHRMYKNGEMAVADNGDELRPQQQEQPGWATVRLTDSSGYVGEAFSFSLEAGAHSISLVAIRETMAVGALRLVPASTAVGYDDVEKDLENNAAGAAPIRIEGETAVLKSDMTLYPLSDRSNYHVSPGDPYTVRLNTIGGDKWKTAGQWLEWKFDVEHSGYYRIRVKARQTVNLGQPSYRRLLIDGAVPFAEADCIRFEAGEWSVTSLGGEQAPWLFYLEAGPHTLRMEVTLGELRELIVRVGDAMDNLSRIYREILAEVGHDADPNRDYRLEEAIPETLKALRAEGLKMTEYYEQYTRLVGGRSSQTQILLNMAGLAQSLTDRPSRIPRKIGTLSDYISALGDWLATAQSQPLEIDYIEAVGSAAKTVRWKASFWKNLWFGIRQFFHSFANDYGKAGEAAGDTVEVWITSGQDQANTLNQLAKNDFTAATGLRAQVKLVAAGSLLTATLAHKGPDVALSLPQADPMNYAIRGAVLDVSRFDDFGEIIGRFQSSAALPLTFEGKTYGLPETQSFHMLFYREDILDELGLSVPESWTDVRAMLPVLQKRNMSFGIPANNAELSLSNFAMFLFQRGGQLYSDNRASSVIAGKTGIAAFEDWTSFYTENSLDVVVDFNTRFRSGEMPIGIANYSTYNTLSVFAPELEGKWSFAPVPGTVREDGTVDHTVSSTVTACVILHDAANPQSAWEFIKWWTSAPIQTTYGKELESIMGTAARYQTANVEAIYNIPWTAADFTVLKEQLAQTRGIDEVPGSYMTVRYLDFAFREVINGAEDPGKELLSAQLQINSEMDTKRQEFGLPVEEGKR